MKTTLPHLRNYLLVLLLVSLPALAQAQCNASVQNAFCQSNCTGCTTNIVNLPNNSTHTYNSGVVCITGNVQSNVVINVTGALVCFASTVRFVGNATINITSGNVCVAEGAQANPSANVNVNGGFINDCSTSFNPTYGGSGTPCICDSTAIVLPVDAMNLNARFEQNATRLAWEVIGQRNVAHYQVERSVDGMNFAPLADRVSAAPDQPALVYTAVDAAPPVGHVYYRVRAVDLDGAQTVSNLASVTSHYHSLQVLNAFPNPFQDDLNIEFTIGQPETVKISIVDAQGRIVYYQEATEVAGFHNYHLTIGDLPTGMYILHVSDAEDHATLRIMHTAR